MILGRIILILLLIITTGLYVLVLLPPEQVQKLNAQLQHTFSGQESAVQKKSAQRTALKPLPDDQMAVVIKTLAPELQHK